MKRILLVVLVVFSFTATAQKINPWQTQQESRINSGDKLAKAFEINSYQLLH
jgi:hypothetical protein